MNKDKITDLEAEIAGIEDKLGRLRDDLRYEKQRAMSEIEMLRRFRYLAGNRVSQASNPLAEKQNDEFWRLMDLTYQYGEKGK